MVIGGIASMSSKVPMETGIGVMVMTLIGSGCVKEEVCHAYEKEVRIVRQLQK